LAELESGTTTREISRVTLDDLSRLPAERLARLLLDRAAEDPQLLTRLYATIRENAAVAPRLRADACGMVAASPAMRQVAALLRRFMTTDEPILITGESGTGKELTARAIHDGSTRRQGPFVAVNCAAIPATLVASELFGYEKGAFTGAAARSKGQIEHADNGTLFLDEIGDMPIELQGHLLRFLQEGQIVRVGGREPVPLNVRVVSATNVRLRQAMAEGRFREDLFYRLAVLTVHLPPLRDRREDIEPLARRFLQDAAREFNRPVTDFEPAAMERLRAHAWSGNVRELMSTIRRAVIVTDAARIAADDLYGLNEAELPPPAIQEPAIRPRPGSEAERAVLRDTLLRTQENVTLTAQILSVSRVTLYRMLRRHAIELGRGLRGPPIATKGRG
jgi:transcriptional regulator with PAS, ATPase and Fis domain